MLYVIKLVFEMINAKFFRNFDGNALIIPYSNQLTFSLNYIDFK